MVVKLYQYFRRDWFLSGMMLAVVLASLFPAVGQSGGTLHLEKITGAGIALIFFLHGIGLSPEAIRQGLGNWRLHLLVQSATFVFYPLVWLVLSPAFFLTMPEALALGFCYLMVLPGTISSSVAMTSAARGNISGAIFNASLSSLLGVFITPLLVQLLMGMSSVGMDVMDTIVSIMKLLLLPMVVGQLLRPLLWQALEKRKNIINKLDKLVILMIVYNAFADSVADGIWRDFEWTTLLTALVAVVVVLFAMVHFLQWLTRRLGFSKEDEIAAVFCGSKKTLASGVPMAKVIFGANPMLGMILLPIMLYHQVQIFYCAILARKYASRAE